MGIEAYHSVQHHHEPPRATEYRRLGELTAGLLAAQEKERDARFRANAVWQNQQFWSRLRITMLAPNTGLPDALRVQFISLAEWVEQESVLAATGDHDLESLIAVNQQIMEGLKPLAVVSNE